MDLIMQIGTQPHCHRVVNYFTDREQWDSIFPEHFADTAEELGPHTDNHGPCLALFRNMHITPQQFNAWLRGCPFVHRVTTRVFWLQQALPASSREELVRAIHAAGAPAGLTGVRLDVFPKSIMLDIGNELYDAGYTCPMHPVEYSHVLFIVQLGDNTFHWSYMEQELVWKNPADAPAHFNKSVATAINKIAEAMHVLGLKRIYLQHSQLPGSTQQAQQQLAQQQLEQQEQAILTDPQQQQQKRWAIDIGACPGGWTSYLADTYAFNVIAIDPAALHPDVTARPGVKHIKGRAQDAAEQIDALLAGQQVDLLVCDMNDHPKRMHDYIMPLLNRLRAGGWLILTLKFYGKGREKHSIGLLLDKIFQGQLEPGRMMWLLANTPCERTYAARKC